MVQELIERLLSPIMITFNYAQYYFCNWFILSIFTVFRLVIKRKMHPYSIWMHTFYLKIRFYSAGILYVSKNNNGFALTLLILALLYLELFEIFNLYMAIKVERQEICKVHNSPVTADKLYQG